MELTHAKLREEIYESGAFRRTKGAAYECGVLHRYSERELGKEDKSEFQEKIEVFKALARRKSFGMPHSLPRWIKATTACGMRQHPKKTYREVHEIKLKAF